MNAPNIATGMAADAIHADRLRHAERIRQVRSERGPDAVSFDRLAQRILTARRLAVAGAATVLAAMLVAGALGVDPAQAGAASGAGGGHFIVIR